MLKRLLFLGVAVFLIAVCTQPNVKVSASEELVPPAGMVLIQAGEYQMGDHYDGLSDSLPVHAVYIDAFYMDIYQVTNQEFADALNWAQGQGSLVQVTGGVVYKYDDASLPYCSTTSAPTGSPDWGEYSRITWDGSSFGVVPGLEWHPMLCVNWFGAAAYSNWRSEMSGRSPSYDTTIWECDFDSSGYRLPTEAEWEKAARGGEYSPYFRYPWGDTLDPSNANYWESGDPYETGGYPWTTPVGYYDGSQVPAGTDMANGYGLYDMAGNVWEWCNDWYEPTYYGSPYDNPQGPSSGTARILRGSAWNYISNYLLCAYRGGTTPENRNYGTGFRLVLDVPEFLAYKAHRPQWNDPLQGGQQK